MNRSPHEIRAEAAAIRQLLEVTLASSQTKSHAQFLASKLESAARRLDDAANTIASREARNHG